MGKLIEKRNELGNLIFNRLAYVNKSIGEKIITIENLKKVHCENLIFDIRNSVLSHNIKKDRNVYVNGHLLVLSKIDSIHRKKYFSEDQIDFFFKILLEDDSQKTERKVSNSQQLWKLLLIAKGKTQIIDRDESEEVLGISDAYLNLFCLFAGFVGWIGYLNDLTIEEFIEENLHISPDNINRQIILKPKTEVTKDNSLINTITEGSKLYFEELTRKTGQFGYLELKQKKDNDFIEINIKDADNNIDYGLYDLLPILDQEDNKRAILIGEGGMGKTLSFLRLWKNHLEKNDKFIPLYVPLNEYNSFEEEPQNYILKYIAWNYLKIKPLDSYWEQKLRKLFTVSFKGDFTFLLLLDGFNEISINKTRFLKDFNTNWATKAFNSIIIISSRYDIRFEYNLKGFHLYQINDLSEEKIKEYLKINNLSLTNNIIDLLVNPMLLSFYLSSSGAKRIHEDNPYFEFKEINSQGELLWNYFEFQYSKYYEIFAAEPEKISFYNFLFKHFIPLIAYEMEKTEHYFLLPNKFDQIIKSCSTYFYSKIFLDVYRDFRSYICSFNLEMKSNEIEESERISSFQTLIANELHLFQIQGGLFWFQHQSFRDFFASIHILNKLKQDIKSNEIPEVLTHRIINSTLLRYVGEITGEHLAKPSVIPDHGWSIRYKDSISFESRNSESEIIKTLDLCRNIYKDNKIGNVVNNIITVIKICRKELSGIDLSRLDLSKVSLNGIRFFRKYKDNYLNTNFKNSLINDDFIFKKEKKGDFLCVEFIPESNFVVFGGVNGDVGKYCLKTKRTTFFKERHATAVITLSVSKSGKLLLSSSDDCTVKLWSIKSEKCINTFKLPHEDILDNLYKINKKEDDYLENYEDEEVECESINAFLMNFHQEKHKIYSDYDTITKIKFFPDNENLFVTGSYEGIILIWSINSNNILYFENKSHSSNIVGVEFSKDKEKFISACYDGIINEWEVDSGRLINSIETHNYLVNATYVPEDNNMILCGFEAGHIELFSFIEKTSIKEFEEANAGISCMTTIFDNSKFLTGNYCGMIQLWDIHENDYQKYFKSDFNKIDFKDADDYAYENKKILSLSLNPDYKKIIFINANKITSYLDISANEILDEFSAEQKLQIRTIAYSHDGGTIISGLSNGDIYEWSLSSNKLINVYLGHSDSVNCISFNEDNSLIFSGSSDRTIKIWSTITGECVYTLEGHFDSVRCLDYYANKKLLATGSDDFRIRIWDLSKKNTIKLLFGDKGYVKDVHFNKDGSKVLAAYSRLAILEWDIVSGEIEKDFSGGKDNGHKTQVFCCYYHPSLDRIISGSRDETIKLWDNYYCLKTIPAHHNGVYSVQFNNDGTRILSCGQDNWIYEWDAETGEEIRGIEKPHDPDINNNGIEKVIYSPDYKYFLSFGQDGDLKEWNTYDFTLNRIFKHSKGLYFVANEFIELHPESILSLQAKECLKVHGAKSG